MKIVIIGCGRVGRTIIKLLSQEGHDITALDTNEEVLRKLSGEYDLLTLREDGISVQSQIQAGVGDADLLIAATSSDEKNMICCMTAKKLGAKRTIARVRDPQYDNHLTLLKDELGLSMSVNPEFALADEIYTVLSYPSAMAVDRFSHDKVEIVEIKVTESSLLNGLKLVDVASKFKTPFLICAVERDGELIIPRGAFTIHAGDRLHVTTENEKLSEFFKEAGVYKARPKRIMIVGAGLATYHLVDKLKNISVQIKIIEKDKDKARKMQETLDYVSVICANATSTDMLEEEGLDNVDAFVALTDSDETNSILSLYAKQRGVKKVITKINHKLVGNIFDQIGLDSIVSTESITANKIVRYVRSLASENYDEVISLYKLFDGQGEAIEFEVKEDSKLVGKKLKDVKIKEDIIIASITHNGEVYLPTGNSEIYKHDTVVIVAKHQYFDTLDDILDE